MTCVKPNLASGRWNAQKLNIPVLEYAARARWEQAGCDAYEFIGRYDALIALGCAQLHMLAVGKSGKKSGPGYNTQRLANDRFRLELRTNDLDIDAVTWR